MLLRSPTVRRMIKRWDQFSIDILNRFGSLISEMSIFCEVEVQNHCYGMRLVLRLLSGDGSYIRREIRKIGGIFVSKFVFDVLCFEVFCFIVANSPCYLSTGLFWSEKPIKVWMLTIVRVNEVDHSIPHENHDYNAHADARYECHRDPFSWLSWLITLR